MFSALLRAFPRIITWLPRSKLFLRGRWLKMHFVALAREQGLAFTVPDLRNEADRVAATPRTAETGEATESSSAEWVLDYFYGQNRKWTI